MALGGLGEPETEEGFAATERQCMGSPSSHGRPETVVAGRYRRRPRATTKETDLSYVTSNQPEGTPTWIDLAVSEPDQARAFYRAMFGWDYRLVRTSTGDQSICLLRDQPVAAFRHTSTPGGGASRWRMYFATEDCDDASRRVAASGGTVLEPPVEMLDLGRVAVAEDPTGATFGLWQGRALVGAEVVNEPGSLVRNDLLTPDPEPARVFYADVFGYTLDRNEDLPGADFTFLRRPDGYEIGGIFGSPGAAPAWATLFEVADTDIAVKNAVAAGGTAAAPEDSPYGRTAVLTDPAGTEFSVITRP
ncbi:MAG: glyoxalase [Amycolatopsis sp.]|nr:glyoxalase [Amycolatopsis sp.]